MMDRLVTSERATAADFRRLGRDRAALIAPALVRSVTILIHSFEDPEREVPDSAFAARLKIAFDCVDELLPMLRGIGASRRDLQHYRRGARDVFLEQIQLARAAGAAPGQPN